MTPRDRAAAAVPPAASEEVVGRAQPEVVEEDLVELVVVVLPGVHEHVVDWRVERGDDARQPDDLGPRPDERSSPSTQAHPSPSSSRSYVLQQSACAR